MNPPLVYCVILSWNGRRLTVDCVRSVLDMDYPRFSVIVVDNASSDNSVEALEEAGAAAIASGRLTVIENAENLGFAGGNNVGLDAAFRNGADYVLLLNNDTVVDRRLLAELVRETEPRPSVGISGPKIYYHEPPDRIWFAGGEVFLHRGISRHTGIRDVDRGQYDRVRCCDYITGCAMLVRRSVYESIGGLDTAYRLYSEDADYCMRASRMGFQMLYVPSAKVWHKISASTGGQINQKKIRLRLESSFLFYRRYARWYHWLTIPFFFGIDTMRILALIVFGKIRNQ